MIKQPLRDKIRKAAGLNFLTKAFSIADILEKNWNHQFIKYMKNRMILGFFRYGAMDKKTGLYDNIGSIEKRILKFKEDGNDEHLVDIANICMCEFVNGVHPKKHFKSIDDGEHAKKL